MGTRKQCRRPKPARLKKREPDAALERVLHFTLWLVPMKLESRLPGRSKTLDDAYL